MLAKHQLPPSVTTAFRRRPSPSDQPKPTATLLQRHSALRSTHSGPPTPHSPNQGRPQDRKSQASRVPVPPPPKRPKHEDPGIWPPSSSMKKDPSIYPSRAPLYTPLQVCPHGSLMAFLFRVEPNFRGFKNLSTPPGSTPGSQLKRLKNKQTFRAGAWPGQG